MQKLCGSMAKLYYLFFFTEVELLYNVVLVSDLHNKVIQLYVYIYPLPL